MALISCTLIFSYISLSIYFKTSLVLITISSIFFALILNPVIFDRYIQQLKFHIISDEKTQKFYRIICQCLKHLLRCINITNLLVLDQSHTGMFVITKSMFLTTQTKDKN